MVKEWLIRACEKLYILGTGHNKGSFHLLYLSFALHKYQETFLVSNHHIYYSSTEHMQSLTAEHWFSWSVSLTVKTGSPLQYFLKTCPVFIKLFQIWNSHSFPCGHCLITQAQLFTNLDTHSLAMHTLLRCLQNVFLKRKPIISNLCGLSIFTRKNILEVCKAEQAKSHGTSRSLYQEGSPDTHFITFSYWYVQIKDRLPNRYTDDNFWAAVLNVTESTRGHHLGPWPIHKQLPC